MSKDFFLQDLRNRFTLVKVNTLQSFAHAFRLPATCNKGVTNDDCLAVLIENAPG